MEPCGGQNGGDQSVPRKETPKTRSFALFDFFKEKNIKKLELSIPSGLLLYYFHKNKFRRSTDPSLDVMRGRRGEGTLHP